ncbi:MAG: hypothetical protein IPG17_15170 [Sandaracinaceae bacterium]|jgi:hypothetical protein|nr:hypothetical protein [Sandaracinaceae bacterium]MBP7684610.1 hypothetical protein [Deltaproteobacteria bacterium]MBK7154031.1 hypothetical protein [Sandaracinaceae bacterium]MBK7776501.1 hypothetical protein [Sandaracinaceae bacterium]MBK8408493.1 hypothetical protein [Sandaracinaceae bacterium]
MITNPHVAISAALLAAVSTGCGGGAATAPPTGVATEAADTPSDGPGLEAPAVRRLPRNVDYVMRVHLGPVRGTTFEAVVLGRLPLSPAGADRDLQNDVLAHTEVVTIGLGEEAVGWVFEGELGHRFDTVIERFSANGTPTVTGSAGQRSVGDERTAIGEVGESAMTVHIPAAAAVETGDIPPAVVSHALQRLAAALPAVPARRAILFEAWAAPAWGIFRELKLVVRMTYGVASNDVHIDAALLYPDAEMAAARASGWAEFWGAFVEESPESFDRDSAAIRRDGAELVLHHELRGLFDEPSANQRVIMWTLASLAAHQPSMNFH